MRMPKKFTLKIVDLNIAFQKTSKGLLLLRKKTKDSCIEITNFLFSRRNSLQNTMTP
jgi:hypothetical protein